MIGAGLLVAGIALFIILGDSQGPLKYVGALAAVGGLVALSVNAFLHINRLGQKSELDSQMAKLQEQIESVKNRFEVEHAVIGKLMKDTDSDSVEELKTKITKFRDLRERYQSVLDRKKKLAAEINLDKLTREEEEHKKTIKNLEEELRRYPAFSMGLNEMRLEIERLERVLRMTNPNHPLLKDAKPQDLPAAEGHAVPDLGVSSPRVSSPAVSGTRITHDHGLTVRSAPQAYDRLLMSGARLFDSERGQLIKHVSQRFNLYVQALFGKRYSEARIDPDSTVALKENDTGKWTDFERLSPAARDTVYLALQITLLELATQKRHLPIILDNPASRLDETAALVSAKALKRVSERTQVVFFSSQRGPLQFADHSLELT
jgi:DNA repair exonuclease SbcCD ATPase subunit